MTTTAARTTWTDVSNGTNELLRLRIDTQIALPPTVTRMPLLPRMVLRKTDGHANLNRLY